MTPSKLLFRLGAAAAALLLSACAVATPASRVAQAPQLFEGLPTRQQQAVLQGRVEEGMTPDAVFLAMGRPNRIVRGSQNGTPFELWHYTELRPVYHQSLSFGHGFGHRRGFYDPGWGGWETGPVYVPVTAAVVRFNRNRVTGWERSR